MEFLDPPHIQIGAYWHYVDETEAFSRVLAWLGARGCQSSGDMLAFHRHGGKLPRFQSLYLPRPFSREEERRSESWTFEEAMGSTEWLPVALRMTSAPPESLELELAYAPLGDHSFRVGEAHVVEITLSGAEADGVQNCPAGTLPPEVLNAAEETLRWSRNTFRALCDELSPSYAAYHWERALNAPTSLLTLRDFRDYEDLFIAEEVVSADELVRAMREIDLATAERFKAGAYIGPVRSAARTAEQGAALANTVAELLRKGLQLNSGP